MVSSTKCRCFAKIRLGRCIAPCLRSRLQTNRGPGIKSKADGSAAGSPLALWRLLDPIRPRYSFRPCVLRNQRRSIWIIAVYKFHPFCICLSTVPLTLERHESIGSFQIIPTVKVPQLWMAFVSMRTESQGSLVLRICSCLTVGHRYGPVPLHEEAEEYYPKRHTRGPANGRKATTSCC